MQNKLSLSDLVLNEVYDVGSHEEAHLLTNRIYVGNRDGLALFRNVKGHVYAYSYFRKPSKEVWVNVTISSLGDPIVSNAYLTELEAKSSAPKGMHTACIKWEG